MTEREVPSQDTLQHSMLSGESAYEEAIDRVIRQAEQTLHIFDHNLARGGYGSAGRHAALSNFLRRNGRNRLVIVLHDTDFLVAYCPRLVNLLKTHSHAIAIHKTMEHAHTACDPFVIADAAHYVHRFHRDGARLLLALHDRSGAQHLEERFGQLLEASYPAVFATILGL